ncbi:hypothetical protein GQ44DRAFT_750353 [Phaeosphaeriaceae sp. PMI808]|nr:hypothetical protein GQ44DRAFT_750353 [Phaeosphaeriaceae sp. PMI808]
MMLVPTYPKLFEPLRFGEIELSHRTVMAPLTRCLSTGADIPLPFVKEYDDQRDPALGTLIVSEAAGGSYTYPQPVGNGRAATPAEKAKDGLDLIGPSAIPIGAARTKTKTILSSDTPREVTEHEIWTAIPDFVQVTRNAVHRAGFDGVEIHARNGEPVDQFIQGTSNQRTSVCRGLSAVGKEKVWFRFSPWSTYLSIRTDDPVPQFLHVIEELDKLDVTFILLVERRVVGDVVTRILLFLDAWGCERPVIVAGRCTGESAEGALDKDGIYEEKKVAWLRLEDIL